MESIFQECVKEAKEQGKTVLLSSHILAEVEALYDRVSIIRQGQIVESGTLEDLRHLTRTTVTVGTALPVKNLKKLLGVHDVTQEGEKWRFSVDSDAMEEVIRELSPLGVKFLTAEPPSLEELFMRHYGDDIRADGGVQK